MNDRIKKKIETLIEARQRKDLPSLGFQCPLKSWDIFSMVQAEIKKQSSCKNIKK